jgi:hypothetical protein
MSETTFERGLDILDGRTRAVRITLFIYIAASIGLIVGRLGEAGGLVSFQGSELDPLSMVVGAVYLSYIAMLVVSMIVAGMWIYRAHANLRAAGMEGFEFSPSWAVGWFFVPLANLFKPFQAMRELWNTSRNELGGYTEETDPILRWWWGTWLFGNILSNIGSRFESHSPNAAIVVVVIDAIAFGLLIAAAFLLIRITTAVNTAQRAQIGLGATFA